MMAKPQMWWPGINRQHPLARGLVGAWSMSEGAGGMIRDVSGHHHDGTLSGPTWEGGPNGWELDYVPDVWVDVGSGFTQTEFSIVVLAELESLDGTWYRYLWGREDSIALGIERDTLSSHFGVFLNDGSGFTWYTSGYVASPGDKGLWGMTRNAAGDLEFYVGGKQQAGVTAAEAPQSNSNASRIGAFTSQESWDGPIEMFAFWDRALPARAFTQLAIDPYVFFRIPSLARRHVAAVEAVDGLARMVFITGDI